MKGWISIGILSVLVIGIVLMSGCTNNAGSSGATSTSTPQIVDQVQYPMIGVWRNSSSTGDFTDYDYRIRFNADGTYKSSFYILMPAIVTKTSHDVDYYMCTYGTWSAQNNDSITTKYSRIKVSADGETQEQTTRFGTDSTYKYDTAQKIITDSDKSSPREYTRYNGDVTDKC